MLNIYNIKILASKLIENMEVSLKLILKTKTQEKRTWNQAVI